MQCLSLCYKCYVVEWKRRVQSQTKALSSLCLFTVCILKVTAILSQNTTHNLHHINKAHLKVLKGICMDSQVYAHLEYERYESVP